jgi:hypothetical protein
MARPRGLTERIAPPSHGSSDRPPDLEHPLGSYFPQSVGAPRDPLNIRVPRDAWSMGVGSQLRAHHGPDCAVRVPVPCLCMSSTISPSEKVRRPVRAVTRLAADEDLVASAVEHTCRQHLTMHIDDGHPISVGAVCASEMVQSILSDGSDEIACSSN